MYIESMEEDTISIYKKIYELNWKNDEKKKEEMNLWGENIDNVSEGIYI